MTNFSGVFAVFFVLAYIAVVICTIILAIQFVRAHERIANALENLARKFRDDDK